MNLVTIEFNTKLPSFSLLDLTFCLILQINNTFVWVVPKLQEDEEHFKLNFKVHRINGINASIDYIKMNFGQPYKVVVESRIKKISWVESQLKRGILSRYMDGSIIKGVGREIGHYHLKVPMELHSSIFWERDSKWNYKYVLKPRIWFVTWLYLQFKATGTQ